jgi:hypothetical protein
LEKTGRGPDPCRRFQWLTSPRTWASKALDVEAQQADRPRHAMLHAATAQAVEPVFRASFRGLAAADAAALAKQMAAEFACACWATLLSRLNRQRGADGLVNPRELLPDDVLGGQTPLLAQVLADARHFGLSSVELNQVMADTLETLARNDVAEPDFLRWPLGLHVDRLALWALVKHTQLGRLRAVHALQGQRAAPAQQAADRSANSTPIALVRGPRPG